MMRFDVLTLFPEIINAVMGESIIGKAREKNLIELNVINIRDFSKDKHKKADDYPYGGGCGMIMLAQPIYDAYSSIISNVDYKPKAIYLSPQGRVFNQGIAEELKEEKHIILVCGHYEGIDERVIEEISAEEISAGDYVLTGGELPAMIVIDCISRLIPGVLSSQNSYSDESLCNGLLEYPQYTRPFEFMNRRVPDVLMSGHHANINRWRRKQSLKRTWIKRPDLLEKTGLTDEDRLLLREAIDEIKSVK